VRSFRKQFAGARIIGGKLARKDEAAFPEGGFDVLDFCERVAFLTRNGHLDEVQVWSDFGNWIGAYNHDLGIHIHQLRARQKTAYEDFIWLVERLRKIDEQKGGSFFVAYSNEELERLYTYDGGHEDDLPC
jgi:hypothetical protein